jgi:histidinol-phosphatase
MAMPAVSETYWAARGRGAWLGRPGSGPAPLRVSGISDWEESSLSFGEFRGVFAPERERAVLALARTAAQARCYGDLAGAAMVLTGRAEAWIEAGVKVWDIAPLKILAEEAGGRFTDLAGLPTAGSGNCLLSNGRVHEHVLRALSAPSSP